MNLYIIWCVERGNYWKKNHAGYTADIFSAGQYSEEEAIEICKKANLVGRVDEMMIPTISVYPDVNKS